MQQNPLSVGGTGPPGIRAAWWLDTGFSRSATARLSRVGLAAGAESRVGCRLSPCESLAAREVYRSQAQPVIAAQVTGLS